MLKKWAVRDCLGVTILWDEQGNPQQVGKPWKHRLKAKQFVCLAISRILYNDAVFTQSPVLFSSVSDNIGGIERHQQSGYVIL